MKKSCFILKGKILDVTINLNKGKNFGKIFYFNLKKMIFYLFQKVLLTDIFVGEKNTILYFLNKNIQIKIILDFVGMIKISILNGE